MVNVMVVVMRVPMVRWIRQRNIGQHEQRDRKSDNLTHDSSPVFRNECTQGDRIASPATAREIICKGSAPIGRAPFAAFAQHPDH
jgi:hypothetical protein